METYKIPSYESIDIIKSLDQWQDDLNMELYQLEDDSYPTHKVLLINDQGKRHLALDQLDIEQYLVW